MNRLFKTCCAVAVGVGISACGGGGGGSGADSSPVVSGLSNPSGGTFNPLLQLRGVCGDLVTYPQTDVVRLLERDPDAWHLFELDVRLDHPNATYSELLEKRLELDAEVKLFIPDVIEQMQENADFIASGGVYDEWQIIRTEHAQQFNGATVLFDDAGEVSGLQTPDGYVETLFSAPGTCGGELIVRIGFQNPGSPNVALDLGMQFDTSDYPRGYNILYRYSRGNESDDFDFAQTFYTKLGISPVVNFQTQVFGLPAEEQESLDWDADFAVTEAMIVALRQLRLGASANPGGN